MVNKCITAQDLINYFFHDYLQQPRTFQMDTLHIIWEKFISEYDKLKDAVDSDSIYWRKYVDYISVALEYELLHAESVDVGAILDNPELFQPPPSLFANPLVYDEEEDWSDEVYPWRWVYNHWEPIEGYQLEDNRRRKG